MNDEVTPQPAGIVERLVRDDVDRKRFLKIAGSGAGASFRAFVLAACGSSKNAGSTARQLDGLRRLSSLRNSPTTPSSPPSGTGMNGWRVATPIVSFSA